MGTDIHLWVEKIREDCDGWWPIWPPILKDADIECWAEGEDDPEVRNYNLFAFLADVRNGYGVAGIVTGVPVMPQVAGRGIPHDTCWIEKDKYLGYHNYTHATLAELIGLPWDMEFRTTGLVDKASYESMRNGIPEHWYGGIEGKDVVIRDDEAAFLAALESEPEKKHYMRLWWTWRPLTNCAFRRWLDTLVPLAPGGNLEAVRVVMGFDN